MFATEQPASVARLRLDASREPVSRTELHLHRSRFSAGRERAICPRCTARCAARGVPHAIMVTPLTCGYSRGARC